MVKRDNDIVGSGSRVFAAVMAVVWIAAGGYGFFQGLAGGPWYLPMLAILAIIYGVLWANVARTGRLGRIPLWP
jgi:hypothetical protein